MKKIIIRYFYTPICPEAFASLDRLYNLFSNYKEQVDFESFNVFDCKFESSHPWFPSEEEIIKSVNGNGTYPLLYGELFIQGNQIEGFPPSPKSISNALKEYGIFFKEEDYKFDYTTIKKEIFQCDNNRVQIKRYGKKILRDTCIICTKYNPYLDEKAYFPENWIKYEQLKGDFLKENLDKGSLIGYIGYYDEMPVGFIEAFPLDISKKLGFPISSKDDNDVMITCLSVRKEMSGQGIATRLIDYLEKEAKEKKYKSIEVLSFPDEHNWQPKSLYEKNGYKKVKEIRELFIMKKEL
ncbi:GNAT family N-acetyltransferase [Proteiniborus sp. MB09-C3]|uniref:GNAT family N-acetyltransferase n=1 Tax=Proteiniborus sp. MB09-C3 TaxID=3050072 RepID=UPI002553FFEE|nr:GNAT family N-acetyltransferase [Proteiniborus sp. MB09-C3]WIV11528.1 GNAT family N-acetyltransferase [Proteiniborus sp. MB09-C3]